MAEKKKAERKSKNDLVNTIAEANGLTKSLATKILDSTFETIQDWVASGKELNIIGFGTFTFSNREERTGKNPLTGAMITIAASRLPKFKAGKAFKDAVNK